MVDLKHRLEIALSIERISCAELARKWNVSSPHVWRVVQDPKQSAPIYKKIIAFIRRAEDKLREEILIKEAV